MLNVAIIPMNSDNFCYYVFKNDMEREGFLIDASQIDKFKLFWKSMGFQDSPLKYLFTTHHHGDHSGANKEL